MNGDIKRQDVKEFMEIHEQATKEKGFSDTPIGLEAAMYSIKNEAEPLGGMVSFLIMAMGIAMNKPWREINPNDVVKFVEEADDMICYKLKAA